MHKTGPEVQIAHKLAVGATNPSLVTDRGGRECVLRRDDRAGPLQAQPLALQRTHQDPGARRLHPHGVRLVQKGKSPFHTLFTRPFQISIRDVPLYLFDNK